MINLDYALRYAARGWRALPAHSIREGRCTCTRQCTKPGKHPRISKWQNKATTDTGQIEQWWHRWPDANIAIATGEQSNLIVVDIDPGNGGNESLSQLIEQHPELAPDFEAPTVLSGGGGTHYYFQWIKGQKIRRNALDGGIDIQADGACIIAPPSLHLSGNSYQNNNMPEVLLPFPECLKDILSNRVSDRFNEALLQGNRNNGLASIAGKYLQQGNSKGKLLTYLQEENQLRCKPSLNPDEVQQIAESILNTKQDNSSFLTQWERAVTKSSLPDRTMRVLWRLSTYMNDQGRECFPSQDKLAEDMNIDRTNVNRHINIAKDKGWIETYPHKTGHSWSLGYIATIPDI